MSLVGTQLLPFRATAFHQGDFVQITDEDLRGRWAVVFFYPADFSFVCPTELGDLADHYDEFTSLGVEIYAASTDTHFVHAAWHAGSDQVGKAQYYMLGDPSAQLAANFQVLREGEGLAHRGTFLIDPDGVIQLMEVSADGIARDASELLRRVRAAQYVRQHPDRVCPAHWDETGDALAPGLDLVGKI
ncbi:alkyl hydroperoxide reductase subunit C [uncultured Propionibacterium sp.]|uniref:alkyl hydroperoxide reductase subunit C n=1 Tax=uncultured Propionibacterium sp. TaxID=218066 RepID=UPI002930EF1D|nr:alkyl hydroperoxide reductase subunit C [uncultured Propionibacterium sp.]